MASTITSAPDDKRFTAFLGHRRIGQGTLASVRRAATRARAAAHDTPALLVFDDASGAQIDLDPRGEQPPVSPRTAAPEPAAAPRSAGRPKLGVVAREVTLLPRHWEWLSLQPGGASVALRKLVEDARRTQASRSAARAAQERCYRFLQAIAGDLPGYEEGLRALYRGDADAFAEQAAAWPADIREYATALSADAFTNRAAS
jgi:hypothetical protein